jgi:hypothetical protein
VGEQTPEQERVVIGEAPDQHVREGGAFLAQPGSSQ